MSNVTQAWLEDQTSIRCLLVELTAKDVVANTEVTFYLSDSGFVTSGTTGIITYLPYLTGSLQTTESLNIDGGLSMSFGNIEIANLNGDLDTWLDSTKYIWVNRPVQVYLGDPRWSSSTTTLDSVHTVFEKVFDGLIADLDSSSREYLSVKVRDKSEKLNYPVTDSVLGTYGVWGNGQTNQDSIRPLIFGEVNNITPLFVGGTAAYDYMFNDTNTTTVVTATSATATTSTETNELTCTSTLGMVPNKPITFSTIPVGSVQGTTYLGGLDGSIDTYYVRNITSPTTFTIQNGNSSSGTAETVGTDCLYNTGGAIYVASTTGLQVGQPVVFSGSGIPSPLIAGITYYITNVVAVNSYIRIATTLNGAYLTTLTSTSAAYTVNATNPSWWLVQNIGTAKTLTTTTGKMYAETRTAAITATCTSCTTSLITCNSIRGFAANKPIVFSGTTFGGIVAGVVYYIKVINSLTYTNFSISDTITNGVAGTAKVLTAASGSMLAETMINGSESVIEIRDNGVAIYTDPDIYTSTRTRPSGAYVNIATGKFRLTGAAGTNITASVQGVRRSVNFIDNVPPVFESTYVNNANHIIALIALRYGQPNNRLTYTDLDIANLSSYSYTDTPITITGVTGVTHTYTTGTAQSVLVIAGVGMPVPSSLAAGDWVAVSGLSHASLNTTLNNAAQILTLTSNSIALKLPNTVTAITTITMVTANTVVLTKIDWASVGVAVLDRANVLNVLKDIAGSVNGQVFFNRLGKLQLLKLGTYTSDSAMSITDNDILHHSLHISRRTEVVAATKIGYCRNYTPQTALKTGIPLSSIPIFSDEWYSQSVLDTTVQTNYKLDNVAVQKDTKLISGRDAANLALQLNNYFKVPRTVYAFTGTAKLMYLKLGQQVTLTHNRFGLNNGKTGQVITLAPDWAAGTVNVEVII